MTEEETLAKAIKNFDKQYVSSFGELITGVEDDYINGLKKLFLEAHAAGFAAGRLSGLEEARLITSDESKKRHGCSDCGAKEVDEGYNYGRWSASVDIGDAITKAKGETS